MNFKITVYTILTFLLIPLLAISHGEGASYEEIVEGKFIDIGYSPEVVEEMQPIRFDFDILDESTGEKIEFSDVWVRIFQDRKVFFAGSIHKATFGVTGFTFVFPEEGTYEVSARYQNDGDIITESIFPIEVLEDTTREEEGSSSNDGVIFGVVGLLFGLIGGFIVSRRRKDAP